MEKLDNGWLDEIKDKRPVINLLLLVFASGGVGGESLNALGSNRSVGLLASCVEHGSSYLTIKTL